MCMYHTWGGRPKPDACVRSPRARALRPRVHLAPSAVARPQALALSLAYHIIARTSPVWACVGRVHTATRDATPLRVLVRHRSRAASSGHARMRELPQLVGMLRATCVASRNSLARPAACLVQRLLLHETVRPLLRSALRNRVTDGAARQECSSPCISGIGVLLASEERAHGAGVLGCSACFPQLCC